MVRELQMLDGRADSGMGGGSSGYTGNGGSAPSAPSRGAPTGFEQGPPMADNAPTLSDDTDFEDDIPF